MAKIVATRIDDQQVLEFVRVLLDSDLARPYDSGYFKLVNSIGSVAFTGSGFSGFSAELPSTGFITEIDYYSFLREFTLTGGLISLPSLKTAVLAGNLATVTSLLFGGNDTISGRNLGPLVLHGFGGNDTISGGPANDELFGDDGNDVLEGGLGDDLLDGGAGRDWVIFDSYDILGRGVNVDLRIKTPQNTGRGNDLLRGIENIQGTEYKDVLRGDEGPNILDAYLGYTLDELYGYGGDDILYSNGSGVADGGEGLDTLSFYNFRISGLTLDLGGSGEEKQVYRPLVGSTLRMTIRDIERFEGTAASDYMKAGLTGAYLMGVGGNDHLEGGPGNDTLFGGAGDDIIRDTSGSNYLRGDDGNDSIYGGDGFDDINGNKGDDTINGGTGGSDWLVGGQDNDLITAGHEGSNILYGNLGNDTLNGGAGGEILRGGQGDDVISGGAGEDWLSGDRGNDTLTGGEGADIFHTFNGAGVDRVLGFSVAQGDRVQLAPGTVYFVNQIGADTVIDLGGGEKLVLVGVLSSTLPPGWIF